MHKNCETIVGRELLKGYILDANTQKGISDKVESALSKRLYVKYKE